MSTDQQKYLEELEKISSATKNLGRQLHAITPNISMFDLYLITALNRTVNINKAFDDLSKANNFIAAAPLVRINLDTLLRLYAARLSKDGLNEFARRVILDHKQINEMKSFEKDDKNQFRKLTDNYLKKSLSSIEGYDWVEKVYNVGSSFIHLDGSLFFASRSIISDEDRTMKLTIGTHDSFIPNSEKEGATIWMIKITSGIIQQAQLWMIEKAKAHNFDIEKLNHLDDPKNSEEE